MSVRNWSFIVAIGGVTLCAHVASAQSATQSKSVLERDPIASPWQREGAPRPQQDAAREHRDSDEQAPALQRIEAAIRDLKAEQDKQEGKEDREVSDLEAQWAMARWAQAMFWASFASVLVTFGGLLLIWRTLHHTKRAADYASAMIDEAQLATKAAEAAVTETRRVGEAQVRAYVSWNNSNLGISWDDTGKVVGCSLIPSIKNTGQSPARLVALYSYLALTPHGASPIVEFDPVNVACSDELGAGVPFQLKEQHLSLANAEAIIRKDLAGYLMGWVAFRDVFLGDAEPDHVITFCFAITFPQPLSVWTQKLIKEHGVRSVIDLHSVPSHRIAPNRPYK